MKTSQLSGSVSVSEVRQLHEWAAGTEKIAPALPAVEAVSWLKDQRTRQGAGNQQHQSHHQQRTAQEVPRALGSLLLTPRPLFAAPQPTAHAGDHGTCAETRRGNVSHARQHSAISQLEIGTQNELDKEIIKIVHYKYEGYLWNSSWLQDLKLRLNACE